MTALGNLIGQCFAFGVLIHAQQKSVSTHEGTFENLLNLPRELAQIFILFNVVEHFAEW